MPGLQKIPKETILAAIAKLGPCQPIDIRKEIKQGDSFLIGAMLSELVSEGKLVISKTRRGGSPFYYDPERPESLEKISQYLNEKDRRTCALLREHKVLREDAVEPLVRVGLQQIHDFAQRFTVQESGAEVTYWRYFLIPEDEARKLAKGMGRTIPTAAPAAEPVPTKQSVEPSAAPQPLAEEPAQKPAPREKPAPAQLPAQTTEIPEAAEAALKREPKEIKLPSPALEKPEKKKRAPKAKAAVAPAVADPAQPSLQDWLVHDTLYEKVQQYAVSVKGILTHQQSVKPNSELTCVLTSDGPYGKLSAFVIALNKKKVAEKEITQRLLQARGQGMPLLVLSAEPLPAKLAASFEGTLNVYFKKL